MTLPGFFSPAQVWTAAGNTDLSLAQPDPRAGDLMVMHAAIRPSTATLTAPVGWTLQLDQSASDGNAEGADTGSVRHYVWTKVADGSEGVGTVTLTKGGTASVSIGNISQVRSATGTYDIAATYRLQNGDASSWSGVLNDDIGFVTDDLVIVTAAQNGDLSNPTAYTLTEAGTTFAAGREHGEYASTTGNDVEVDLAAINVTAGSSTGAASVTITHSVAVSGVVGVLRIRQGAGTPRSDVWVRSAGAQVGAGSNVSPPYPEHRAGDRLVMVIASKDGSGTPSTPTDWNLLGSWVGGFGPLNTADSGNVRTTIFWRDTSSYLGSGTLAVTNTTGNSTIAQMFAVANDTGRAWITPVGTGVGVSKEDPWSETLSDPIDFPDGAVVLTALGMNTDAMSMSTSTDPTVTAAGVTFGDTTLSSAFETTTGNDSALVVLTSRVVTGATAVTPTAGIDWAGTAPTNGPAGSIGLIVLAAEPASGGGTDHSETPVDQAGLLDSVVLVSSQNQAPVDLAGLTDVVQTAQTAVSVTTDGVGLTDLVEAVKSAGAVAIDTAGMSDSLVVTLTKFVTLVDALEATDTPDVNLAQGLDSTFTDLAGLTDSITLQMVQAMTLTETIGAVDSASLSTGRNVAITDQLGALDNLTTAFGRGLVVTDGLGSTDTPATARSMASLLLESLGITDTAVVQEVNNIAVTITDTLGVADLTALARHIQPTLSDTLSALDSQIFAAVMSAAIVDTIGATDSQLISEGGDSTETSTESLSMSDTVNAAMTVVRQFAETIGVTDQLVRTSALGVARTDPLAASDTVQVVLALSAQIVDVIGVSDDPQVAAAQRLTVTDALGGLDGMLALKTITVELGESLGIGDEVSPAGALFIEETELITAVEEFLALTPSGTGFFFEQQNARVYVGSRPVKRIYYGSVLVWSDDG